jgi:hypothetical protein
MPSFPTACDQRHFIAWLTVSADHMNNSHAAVTDSVYLNNTIHQCTKIDSTGVNVTITEPVQFYFNKLKTEPTEFKR